MPIFSSALLRLPRRIKQLLVICLDIIICIFTVWIALAIRFEEWIILNNQNWLAITISLAIATPIFIINGLYRAIFRYSGLVALLTIINAVAIYGLLYAFIICFITIPGVPRSIGILQPLLLLVAVSLSRALARYWLGGLYLNRRKRDILPKVLIYGAGKAGQQLAAGLTNCHEMQVVGFLDDASHLQHHELNGLKIYNPANLANIVVNKDISYVLLAIPSVSRTRRNQIIDLIRQAHVQVRTLPGLSDLARGEVHASDLRELEIEDLLGRDAIQPNQILLSQNITGKVVMVTGAGGSIGSELCRQIAGLNPSVLLMVELCEFALYSVSQQLEQQQEKHNTNVKCVALLANVQDEQRISQIMQTWQPNTVFHAAAYKHVPLVEFNCAQGIFNNVQGTLVMANQALAHGVNDFVLISTDKAVRPTNIMGASKRLAEMVLQAFAEHQASQTRFSMVRFGNVLGSSGSVVPLFKKQIKDGGPITLTHPDINRFFMTIPEAAQLVIQAGAMAEGGDVFVLDMGEPVKIIDLAKRMVELSGLTIQDDENPNGEIAIHITGLRPGEKLYEELLIGDNPLPTAHPRIMKAHENFIAWDRLSIKLEMLTQALHANDIAKVRELLQGLVQGYQPDTNIVDFVYQQQLLVQ